MVLLGELLARERVERGHLLGEHARALEALGEEHDLADLQHVGHDHGHGPEERLEVVGQLGAARIEGGQQDVKLAPYKFCLDLERAAQLDQRAAERGRVGKGLGFRPLCA